MPESAPTSCFRRPITKKATKSCTRPDRSTITAYHTEAMDRAMEGGIDDVGLGVLFGLELYRYEFAGLLMHAEHLEAASRRGSAYDQRSTHPSTRTISTRRRLTTASTTIPLRRSVACIRVAVPYTGMIISTRESQKCREQRAASGRFPDQRRFQNERRRLLTSRSRRMNIGAV